MYNIESQMFTEFLNQLPNVIKEEDFQEASEVWGGYHGRSEMVIEECSELIQAIMHERRINKPGTKEEVLEESCDVLFTVLNLIQTIGEPDTVFILQRKYDKFTDKLNKRRNMLL
jgi:NTP pyrophosphatase (non-canonical NTP hydrolase)